jgi:hypothetical protein
VFKLLKIVLCLPSVTRDLDSRTEPRHNRYLKLRSFTSTIRAEAIDSRYSLSDQSCTIAYFPLWWHDFGFTNPNCRTHLFWRYSRGWTRGKAHVQLRMIKSDDGMPLILRPYFPAHGYIIVHTIGSKGRYCRIERFHSTWNITYGYSNLVRRNQHAGQLNGKYVVRNSASRYI